MNAIVAERCEKVVSLSEQLRREVDALKVLIEAEARAEFHPQIGDIRIGTRSDSPHLPQFVNRKEAAELLRCSVSSIKRYVSLELLPPGRRMAREAVIAAVPRIDAYFQGRSKLMAMKAA